MTRRNRTAAAVLGITGGLVITGCSHSAPSRPARQQPAPVDRVATAAPRPSSLVLDPAVATARAFIALVCPYNWQSAVSYGRNWNNALASYATPALAEGRRWDPEHVAAVQAELRSNHARQDCGVITGGPNDDADATAGSRQLRFSVTVTDTAAGTDPSTAQQTFDLTLRLQQGRWLITDGQW